jgi:hypothetical protein
MSKVVLSLAAFAIVLAGFVSQAEAARTVTLVRCSQAPVSTWGELGVASGYTVRVYHAENNKKKLYANIKMVASHGTTSLFEGVVQAIPMYDQNQMSYTAMGFSLSVMRGAHSLGSGDLLLQDGWSNIPWPNQPQNPWGNGNQPIKLNCRFGR